ncbi:MAG: ATP-binding protein, partial [Chloroflexota bacterium]|nr:ATP-binding protein [Chloroflexota bacterium]
QHQGEIASQHITVDSFLLTLPPVLADNWLLGEVFDHLVQNAIKSMPAGGKLTVSARVTGPQAYIQVADTGQGMLPETQAQLFKGRAHGRDKTRMGIGLMLTRFYLNACDGDIELTRSDANGTTFAFHLFLAK